MAAITDAERRSLDEVNRTFQRLMEEEPAIAGLFPRQARFRYYGPRGAMGQHPSTVYFYTVDRVNGKFVSGIYRYFKTRQQWKPRQTRRHRRKREAIGRARDLWQQAREGGA